VHIPDGLIGLPTAAGAMVVAGGSLAVALRSARTTLRERAVPLAGMAAAFVFALQMVNFPVAAGTSGHVLGGALAAVLLGPRVALLAMTVVVAVQALAFADGGVLAVGLNVLNMGVVTVLVGWGVFRLGMRLLPRTASSVVAMTALAGWASTMAAAAAFSLEYALGGGGQVPVATVFTAMGGVHALIGIGEGLLSAVVVAAVLARRPDLVHGARVTGVRRAAEAQLGRKHVGVFVAGGIAVAVALVAFVAPRAASDPDGLERVAIDTGIAVATVPSPANASLGNVGLGVAGLALTFVAGGVVMHVAGRRRVAPAHNHPPGAHQ